MAGSFKISIKEQPKPLTRGGTRIMWSDEYEQYDYLEITEVIDTDDAYDAIPPWKDFGASKSGVSVVTEIQGKERVNTLHIPVAEKAPPLLSPFKDFYLVIVTQRPDGLLEGWLVKGCRMKSVNYPGNMHEQVSIVVEMFFKSMEQLESCNTRPDANQ